MDLQDLKRQALAAREFSVPVGPADAPRHITLRLPTQHEIVLASRRSGLHAVQDDAAAHVVLQRALLLLAVVGWSGMQVLDVLPDHAQGTEVLEWSADAVALVIDAHPGWEADLNVALMQHMVERRVTKDTASKN